MSPAPRQLDFKLPQRGGARAGAGRKRKAERRQVPHRPRPALAARHPVHVTLRVLDHVWSLRGRQTFRLVAAAFRRACSGRGFRLAEYSVQGNHLHLIVEAADRGRLARGIQGLEIRIARALNAAMGVRGRVFADRYHAHILRTPSEVAHALAYVRGNFAVHAARRGAVPVEPTDRCSSAALRDGRLPDDQGPPLVAAPETWLLSVGWQRARGSRRSV